METDNEESLYEYCKMFLNAHAQYHFFKVSASLSSWLTIGGSLSKRDDKISLFSFLFLGHFENSFERGVRWTAAFFLIPNFFYKLVGILDRGRDGRWQTEIFFLS